uniref:Putative secreted protein n=1 Tax=Ixodes ricinus TaxID=34613 RepID=A0A6B0UAQ5_IXORI
MRKRRSCLTAPTGSAACACAGRPPTVQRPGGWREATLRPAVLSAWQHTAPAPAAQTVHTPLRTWPPETGRRGPPGGRRVRPPRRCAR